MYFSGAGLEVLQQVLVGGGEVVGRRGQVAEVAAQPLDRIAALDPAQIGPVQLVAQQLLGALGQGARRRRRHRQQHLLGRGQPAQLVADDGAATDLVAVVGAAGVQHAAQPDDRRTGRGRGLHRFAQFRLTIGKRHHISILISQ